MKNVLSKLRVVQVLENAVEDIRDNELFCNH
jgi:hypothetical protein